MLGIPPEAGFVSKVYLLNGAMDQGQIILLCALLASTILNAGYFAPIVFKAFFREPAEGVDIDAVSEAPMCMVVPLGVTATISVFLGLYPDVFFNFINVFTKFGG